MYQLHACGLLQRSIMKRRDVLRQCLSDWLLLPWPIEYSAVEAFEEDAIGSER